MSHAHRAGATAAALRGSEVAGLNDAKLHGLRFGALRAAGRVAKGTSVGLKLAATKQGLRRDPARIHLAQVVLQWSLAVWKAYPKLQLLEKTIQGAQRLLAKARCKWAAASDPACVLVLTLERISWTAKSARLWVSDQGIKVDLLALAPKSVARLAEQAVAR